MITDTAQPFGAAPQGNPAQDFTAQPGVGQGAPATDAGAAYSLGSFGSGYIGRGSSSEVLTTATNALKESLKNYHNKTASEFFVIPLDDSESSLAMPAVIIAARRPQQPQLGIAYHVLLLAAGSKLQQTRTEHFQSTTGSVAVEVKLLPSVAFDKDYMAVVAKAVRQTFADGLLRPKESTTVPTDMKWDDKAAVYRLLNNALMAVNNDLQRAAEPARLNLKTALKGGKERVELALRFHEDQQYDYVDLPVRSDIRATMTAIANRGDNSQNQNQGINIENAVSELARVSAYIDVVWAGDQQPNNPQQMQMLMMGIRPPKFRLRTIITALEAARVMSLELQLLALNAILPINEAGNWMPFFNPRTTGAERGNRVDYKNVGALNIEANVLDPQPGSTYGPLIEQDASFDMARRVWFLNQVFQQQMYFSLDVSDSGTDTWYNGAIRAAALGNTDAMQDLINAADTLTGGEFSKVFHSQELAQVFGPGTHPVELIDDVVHRGYYEETDQHGKVVKRDLRNVDYTYVANRRGVEDPLILARWTDSFQNRRKDIRVRLDERARIIEEVLGVTPVYTGYGRRVTFNPKFLYALGAATRKCGLNPILRNPALGAGFYDQRAGAQEFMPTAAMPMQAMGTFTTMGNWGGTAQAPGGFWGNPFYGGGHYGS